MERSHQLLLIVLFYALSDYQLLSLGGLTKTAQKKIYKEMEGILNNTLSVLDNDEREYLRKIKAGHDTVQAEVRTEKDLRGSAIGRFIEESII